MLVFEESFGLERGIVLRSWIKWSTRNTLRSRIWCKTTQNVGHVSAAILHHIIILLSYHILILVLYRIYTYFTSSASKSLKTSSSLCEVSHSWFISKWVMQNILRFPQTQSIVLPLVFFSALPMATHIGIAYALIHCTSLGFKGASLAALVSVWISMLLLGIYALSAKKLENTREGFSFESFSFILAYLKIALPSAVMLSLEYWAFDVLVFLAGLMPNSEVSTSLIAMCGVNTETIAYMTTYGLSAVASTRVSNELVAGNIDQAKNAMTVTLQLSVLFVLAFVLSLVLGRNIWAGFFRDSHEIIKKFASLTPFLAISITLDSVQRVLSRL